MAHTVGMITIGQAPRDDIVPEIEKLLGPSIRVEQAGALDGLGPAEVAALAPRPGQDALVSRLRDGTAVVIAKQAILDLLQGCLDRLEPSIDAAVVLCTGTFPRFRCSHPVLEPDRILVAATQAVFDGGRLGILIPLESQRDWAVRRFAPMTADPVIAVASPYDDPEALIRAARELGRAGATLVVMNCMGYTPAMKALVRDVAAAPVLLPGSLVARFVAEVL
jgi:protein AroM